MIYKEVTKCRICNSENLIPYLDLGMMPLSNNLAKSTTDPIHLEKYPLKVLKCGECNLSQLSIVVNPEILFKNYVYRSSIAQGYKNHCRAMAIQLRDRFNLGIDSFHIDIAGNDGTLLHEFSKVIGGKMLNVDPAENLQAACDILKIPMLCNFWNIETAKEVLIGYGKADLITATNVFAHVDDVSTFIEAAKAVLKPNGVLILEFPYLIDFIQNNEFDTIYFEHLSYFSVSPLQKLLERHGLTIMDVEEQSIHGGSIRVYIGNGCQNESVKSYIDMERAFYWSMDAYLSFAETVKKSIELFRESIFSLRSKGYKIGAFAASAKGNTLLNSAGISVGVIRYIVDQTTEKIGKYSPGTFIPIISMDQMMESPVDYLVILSWNFMHEIKEKCKLAGYKGKFIIPIPDIKIID